MEFGRAHIKREWIAGRTVIEFGSHNENGSYREIIEPMEPASYIGVDLKAGPGVNITGDFLALPFQEHAVVVSTETIEHVYDWQAFVYLIKQACRPGGYMILTTRAPGFGRHDFPSDHWRFTIGDLLAAFADCEIIAAEYDPFDMGSYLIARRQSRWNAERPSFTVVAAPD
jgi:SAM-dependent methyltransferase